MGRSHNRLLCFVVVAGVCSTVAGAQRGGSGPGYTIAFKSYAPNNTDMFIAALDGSGARPLLPDRALDYNPSFSPDGQWVVFTSHRSGSADVYRVHPDGSQLERLTNDPAFDDQGTLSPDGKSVAFESSRSGQADIWVLDLVTRKLRDVTNFPAGDFRPAWSPDGQWLAFSSDRSPLRTSCPNTTAAGPGPFITPQFTSIYIVRPDGSGLRRITDSTEVAGTPRWSPDGSRLVFYTADPDEVCKGGLILGTGTSQIMRVDLKTGKRETVTAGPGLKVSPRWVDSTRIAYGVRGGIRFIGGGSELSGDFQAPDWSPDHRTMVFQRETDPRGDRDREFRSWPSPDPQFALVRVPGHASFSPAGNRMVYLITNIAGETRNGSVMVSNADGSNRHVIYEGPLSDDVAGPAWAPRGETIIIGVGGFFQRAQIKPARLMSLRADGTGLTPMTQGDTNDGMPSWSPDAQHVVYRMANGTTRRLSILDVATKKSRQLDTGSDYDTFPSWSPRGDWITFTSKRDDDYEIYRIRPDGTGVQRLTHSPGADAHPVFSPDGEWIAFATGRQGFKDEAVQLLLSPTFQPYGEIAVMRADGSGLRLLTDNSTEEGAPSWIPSRKR
jgi:Tol biopolymer transport system component